MHQVDHSFPFEYNNAHLARCILKGFHLFLKYYILSLQKTTCQIWCTNSLITQGKSFAYGIMTKYCYQMFLSHGHLFTSSVFFGRCTFSVVTETNIDTFQLLVLGTESTQDSAPCFYQNTQLRGDHSWQICDVKVSQLMLRICWLCAHSAGWKSMGQRDVSCTTSMILGSAGHSMQTIPLCGGTLSQ